MGPKASAPADSPAAQHGGLRDPFAAGAAPTPGSPGPPPEPEPGPAPLSADELLSEGLRLLRAREYAAAREKFGAVLHERPGDDEARLALGIACFRLDALACAEDALAPLRTARDRELRAAAQTFLALVHRERGALEQARRELAQAGALRGAVSGASTGAAPTDGLVPTPRRLTLFVSISPEFDGNVTLTELDTWDRGSADGVVLFSLGALLRPLPRLGLTISANAAWRQQLRFQEYNLLLTGATVAYSHLSDANRLRVQAMVSYAMLGQASLFWEAGARLYDRVRLATLAGRSLGLAGSYDGRYRGYLQDAYAVFTGGTHSGQLELSYGVAPRPVSVALGYQLTREALRAPAATIGSADFRALAHGPLLRLLAQLSPKVEIQLLATLLRRTFDSGRQDWQLSSDLTAYIEVHRLVELFVGTSLLYNRSTDALFTYLKPTAYAGAQASFSLF